MILSGYIIDDIDLKLNNSKKNIFGIKFRGAMVFVLEIKYYWGIKKSDIEIYVSSLI